MLLFILRKYGQLIFLFVCQYDYVLDHEATKATNKYNVTETLVYTHHKEHLNQTRDVSTLSIIYGVKVSLCLKNDNNEIENFRQFT